MQQFNFNNLPKYWMVKIDINHPFFVTFEYLWNQMQVNFRCEDYKYCGFDGSHCYNGYHGCSSKSAFNNNAELFTISQFQQLVTNFSNINNNYSIF